MSNITGFKSTDIDTYSKVDPATVTKFGYKRQGVDANAMVALYEVATATTGTGTTSTTVVTTPSATVYEGDVLDYNGLRSEIVRVSGSTYTLGRKIDSLVPGLAITIHRPVYLKANSAGVLEGAAASPVIETVTGTISALNGEVVVDNPRFVMCEFWGTANLILTFYKRLDSPTGTAETVITSTVSVPPSNLTTSSTIQFNATNGEAWAQVSVVAAQRFIVRASGYTSGSVNVRLTNMNWPEEGRLAGHLDDIQNTLAPAVQDAFTTSELGYFAIGYEADFGTTSTFWGRSGAPNSSDFGVIVRNIPSGTQDVNLEQVNNTTIDTNSGNKSAGTIRVVLATDQPALTNSLLVTNTTSTTSRTPVARGKLAGSSLTTSYQTVLTMGGAGKILHLYNGTEVPVIISFDGGTTDDWELDPYESAAIDYASNGHTLASGTIQAKLVSGSAATNGGSVRAMVTR